MKKIYLTIAALIVTSQFSFAQWTNGTNIYNTNTGNVGIGTTTPQTKLHVLGGEIRLAGAGTSGITSGAVITFYDSNNTTRYGFLGDASAGNSDIYINGDAGNSLRFGTNGVNDRMFINTSGYVGIGTISPLSLLNIAVPSAKASVAGSVASFLSTNDASNPFGLRTMIYGAPSISNRYVTLQTNDYSLVDGGNLVLQPSIGNVGIGTTTPVGKLNVVGQEAIRVTGSGASGPTSVGFISFYDSNNTTRLGYIGDGSSGVNDLLLIADAGTGLNLGSNASAYRLYINSSGQVCINTSDPKGYQFAVNGSAIATSMTVKLNANWPDYVFKKDYQLPSLQEVKTYIDQNHRLPEMPSEQQIAKDGINLGEMNKILTKKVEELTLYIIEQNKQLTDQQKVNQSLQDQINNLSKAIKNGASK